jgi:hypothetical protein
MGLGFGADTVAVTTVIEGELPEFAMVQLRAGGALIDLVDVSAGAGKWALPKITGGRNLDHLCIAGNTIELKGPPSDAFGPGTLAVAATPPAK